MWSRISRPQTGSAYSTYEVDSLLLQVRGSPDGRLLCLCDKAAGIVEVADAASGERLAHRKTDGSSGGLRIGRAGEGRAQVQQHPTALLGLITVR